MKIYVDEQKRYEDTKATGQCFTAVGAIGLIAIVLLDTGVISLAALDSVNKLMISIVMGLVFLIFFIIGIKSFMELKDISKKMDRNNSLEKEIMEYVTVTHRDELMALASASSDEKSDVNSGDLYYKRAELITSVITEKYSLLEESFLDHMVEEIYSKIYSDIVEE